MFYALIFLLHSEEEHAREVRQLQVVQATPTCPEVPAQEKEKDTQGHWFWLEAEKSFKILSNALPS